MSENRTLPFGSLRQLRILIPLILFAASLVGTGLLEFYHVATRQREGLRDLTQANTVELYRLQNQLSDLLEIQRMDLAERRLTEAALDPRISTLVILDAAGRVLLGNHAEWKGRQGAEVLPRFNPEEARQAILRRNSRVLSPSPELLQGYSPLDAAATPEQLRPEATPLLYLAWDLSEPLAAIQRQALEEALVGGAISLLLAAGLAFLLHRMMIRRLQSLTHLMARVGAGSLDVRVAPRGVDEISELGRSFDLMATQLHDQHQELLAGEARFRRMLEHSPIPVAVCDSRGVFEFLSQSFVATYGYSLEDLPNLERWWTLAYPDPTYRAEVLAIWQRLAAGTSPADGDILRHEHGVTCKDGTVRIVEIQGTPLGNRTVATFNDITERVEAERARARLESDIQHAQKLESLGSLAGGISHDMNNVLCAILGIAGTLRIKHERNAALAASLETIERAAQRGANLVKGLTDFARKGLATREPLNLNDLVRQEVELLAHTTMQRITVSTNLAMDLPRMLGDPSALASSLMNLCINATHAMPNGGTLRLQTRVEPEGSLELSVADTGSGIPPEVQERIFDPFFTTKAVGQGSGLGLAMVAATVKAHGGTISVASSPGQGTCFRLRFPALAQLPASPPAPSLAPLQPGISLRILVVDDDELVRRTVVPLLEVLGHKPHVVISMAEAFAYLEGDPSVALVLLDHNMPGMTGAEGLPILRSRWPEVAVIMVSGYVDAALGRILNAHPEVPLLPKPFGTKELSAAIAAVQVCPTPP